MTNKVCDKGKVSKLSYLAYKQIEDYLTDRRKMFDIPI